MYKSATQQKPPEGFAAGFIKKHNVLLVLRLNSCDNDCVKNIIDRATAAKVVNRFVESLQHGTNSQRTGFALHGFVCIVAGV